MCTNKRWIVNKYTHEHIMVKCGHCPACLQEKANRMTQKIKDNHKDGYVECFVTLTYDRSSAPYIKESDLLGLEHKQEHERVLSVYREHTPFRMRGEIISRRKYVESELGSIVVDNKPRLPFYRDNDGVLRKYYRSLAFRRGKIGVVWFPDVRNFEKRLRQNLKRVFNYNGEIKLFKCAEYGETTSRPHFHVLIQVEASAVHLLRRAVYASWPFANLSKCSRAFELARDAAAYCASYVNCSSYIHEFFQKNFMPKHSHSKHFGQTPKCYSLPEILKKVDAGDMRVTRVSYQDGCPIFDNLPIPKYVVNRYFPIFKGYSRLASSPLVWLQNGSRGDDGKFHLDFSRFGADGIDMNHSRETIDVLGSKFIRFFSDDIAKIDARLTHAVDYYMSVTGKNQHDYLIDFNRVWTCFRATCFRHYWEDEDIEIYEHFDNLTDMASYAHGHEYDDIVLNAPTMNPNEFPSELKRTASLTELYHKKDKTRKVFNRVQNKYQQKRLHRQGLF